MSNGRRPRFTAAST